jgi:hypothetical protein
MRVGILANLRVGILVNQRVGSLPINKGDDAWRLFNQCWVDIVV